MSLLGKKWIIQNTDPQKSTFEKILANRGHTGLKEQEEFHDPFLFNEMEKAVERIHKAIAAKERIIIFGDYDVDGISGTAVLVHILKKLDAQVSYRIPHRVTDGYGLTAKFIPEFAEKDVKLVITVDCGISCHEVVQDGKEKGIDTIVTDHHHIPEQAPTAAVAILHPKQKNTTYPYPELTGSGVAFKLAHALIIRNFPEDQRQQLILDLVDLASLGTVADMGPLTGENRLIVKKGLSTLSQTKWSGLRQIMEVAKVQMDQVDASSIGFRIGPRINAAGRIGNPYLALNLLLQEEATANTKALGQKLEKLNDERKDLTEAALNEALENVNPDDFILIAENPDWHVGIVGLVAGRLAERHGRPAIVMQELDDLYVASARSPQCFNITTALTHCSEFLTTYGGHAQAAGFSLKKENLPAFKKAIKEYAKQELQDQDLQPILNIDCEIAPQEVTFDFLNEFQVLKPFGIANEKPRFILKDIEPLFIDQIGKDGKHLRFTLQLPNTEIKVIAFSMGQYAQEIRQHRKIDLACHLEINHWNNREYLQLHALDIRCKKE